MVKRIVNTLLCILLLLLTGGCDENPVTSDQTADPAHNLLDKDWDQDYLAALWLASDHDDWDVISGLIDPIAGGVVSGVPASWPAGSVFEVCIPRCAIPIEVEAPYGYEIIDEKVLGGGFIDSGGEVIPCQSVVEDVLISIHVPHYYPGVPGNYDYPAVFRLEPHGLEFTQSVQVTFCYPPWLDTCPTYSKFYFWREGQAPNWVYDYSDHEVLEPVAAVPAKDDPIPVDRIVFNTLHFSRWGFENGSGGTSGK